MCMKLFWRSCQSIFFYPYLCSLSCLGDTFIFLLVLYYHFVISMSVCCPIFLSGVPGFQCVGSVCHPVHAARDVQSAAVSAEVAAVCHGGCGGAEQPCPVSTISNTSLQHTILYYSMGMESTHSVCYNHVSGQ